MGEREATLIRVMDPQGPGGGIVGKLKEIFRYRELLANFIRKELKVRYKNSALGFFWSMLNPAMYLVIFTIVFTKFLRSSVPYFPIYLLSGLLAWNLLSSALSGASGSIVGNSSLVTKVFFPREILPLASIGASLIHFCLQFLVLIGGLLIFRYKIDVSGLALIPVALIVELMFLIGLCLIIGSLNVYFRDVQHFLELGLLAWFWMTPIIYPIAFVQKGLGDSPLWALYRANPVTSIVLALQRGIYGKVAPVDASGVTQQVLIDAPVSWYFTNLMWVGLASAILMVVGFLAFHRLDARMAEEL